MTQQKSDSEAQALEPTSIKARQHDSYTTLTIMAFVLPIVGIIVGIVYLTRKSKLDRKLGEHLVAFGILMAILQWIIWSVIVSARSETIYTTLPDQSGTSNTTESAPSTPAKTPAEPVHLSGTGQTATDKFTLASGLATFKITATGSGSFAVWLLNSDGEKIALLANDYGKPYNGSKAVSIDASGQYLLDVDADNTASWTVDIQ